MEPATTPHSCHGVFTDRSIFSLNLPRILELSDQSQAQTYNLGQNKWNIWTTPPPISMMPKWRISCSFAPSSLLWGGMGDNCSILYCPRLLAEAVMRALQTNQWKFKGFLHDVPNAYILPLPAVTPTPLRLDDMGTDGTHTLAYGSNLSTVSSLEESSLPPQMYRKDPSDPTSAPQRQMFMSPR